MAYSCRKIPTKLLAEVIRNLPNAADYNGDQFSVPLINLIGIDMAFDPGLVSQDMSDIVFIKDKKNLEWSLKLCS